ncbi:probable WRKY transcription factor 51 isoform X2 [Phalaenopsis equestris]|uniref:probable WRKY transcription factor 51 isoform X2 n=1 Tax=Phalaenopsis equestris TaxID=78828 RepID=UPI0009E3BAE4|nr:probable WRKY transcription factor 51 isoform X2 [Phalaenopsis equestris]
MQTPLPHGSFPSAIRKLTAKLSLLASTQSLNSSASIRFLLLYMYINSCFPSIISATMELLDSGVLAAAVAVTKISPAGNAGGAFPSVYMEDNDSSFDLSEYFLADEDAPPPHALPDLSAAAPTVHSSEQSLFPPAVTKDNNRDTLPILPRMEEGSRIAFRIQTDVENLDDGYKWRKYGKKSVKNSRNLRNYYRCSTDGCLVKKRVERDHEDPSYLVTTYEGIHNHTSPGIVYYAKQDSVSGRFHLSGSWSC